MTQTGKTETLRFDDVSVGEKLPELVIELTPTLIVSTAIATRDFQDVHHDRDLAHQKGSKDIFMNILTTNGLVERFVADWAGHDVELKGIAIRLQLPPSVVCQSVKWMCAVPALPA